MSWLLTGVLVAGCAAVLALCGTALFRELGRRP
jgi:hypothetical protein